MTDNGRLCAELKNSSGIEASVCFYISIYKYLNTVMLNNWNLISIKICELLFFLFIYISAYIFSLIPLSWLLLKSTNAAELWRKEWFRFEHYDVSPEKDVYGLVSAVDILSTTDYTLWMSISRAGVRVVRGKQ